MTNIDATTNESSEITVPTETKEETEVKTQEGEAKAEPKRGFTAAEVKLHLQTIAEFAFEKDKPKKGNLPSGLVPEFSQNKLSRMLELDATTKNECWAMHRVLKMHEGMSFGLAARALTIVLDRFASLESRRKAALVEIERLKLDPRRVKDLSVADIEAKLDAYKAPRRAQAIKELRTLLEYVKLLEKEAGLTEVTEVVFDEEDFTKEDAERVRKHLLERKSEVEGHLRQSLGVALKKAAKKVA